ncbi:carbamoyltransferase [Enterococcus sp. AZ170]|uniref:carbamoyltransferase family protein n=1 Tax=Enterococcus sp. AZ170 TaxID=2774747 RepID=UPI003D2FB9B7
MKIIGFGGSTHDFSVCLVENGEVKIAIEEERLAKKKYGYGCELRENLAYKYVLEKTNTKEAEIDYFVSNDLLNKDYFDCVKGKMNQLYNHHYTHAASAFYESGFEDTAILVIDHSGSIIKDSKGLSTETISYYRGTENRIALMDRVSGDGEIKNGIVKKPNNSIGYFYSMIAKMLGCQSMGGDNKIHSESGKLMGLSSYGKPVYKEDFERFIRFEQGQVEIEVENIRQYVEKVLAETKSEQETKMNLAATAQKILEDLVVKCADYLYEITKSKNICIAGGVGLNGLANQKILMDTKFENIFICPAANDAGTSIGAALSKFYEKNNCSKKEMKNNFYGFSYNNEEIEQSLEKQQDKIFYSKLANGEKLAAKLIKENRIIAWYQGGSEFGPRSLGNRSILANPCNPKMKDILNNRVKFRESYRPFAPAVMAEHEKEYFEMIKSNEYMLLIPETNKEVISRIPAVVHVDGTARVQSVTKTFNPQFYSVIQEFYKLSSIPVVLNTSFNIKGRPICESPHDAIDCFLESDIDYLFMGNYLVWKI